jgi:hypothetical protein
MQKKAASVAMWSNELVQLSLLHCVNLHVATCRTHTASHDLCMLGSLAKDGMNCGAG